MKLVLLLVILSVVQASPLHGRNLRRTTRKKANEEVRSIISAIVDAILDGDRKRRSEVVDFDETDRRKASSTNLKDDEAQSTKIFTKREEREADDNSVPLADVIATSDVKSRANKAEIIKKDVIQHASDEEMGKNDIAYKESSDDKSGVDSSDKRDKKNNDNVSSSRFQTNFSQVKPEESSSTLPYGIIDGEDEPSFDQNMAQKFHLKSVAAKSSSDSKETENKSSHLKEHSLHPEQKSSNLTQNISTQSDSKKSVINNKQSTADTYAEFLRVTKTPKSIEKHSSVEHMSDDDSEMNENSKKSSSSEKTNKFQESKDSMNTDKEGPLSGSEQNEDKMDDSKDDGQSENDSESNSENFEDEDKFMLDDQGKISSDVSGMDSADDTISEKNSDKQSKVQSKTTENSKPADNSEMDADDEMTSGKSSREPPGLKVQSKTKTTEENDDLEMDSDDEMTSGKSSRKPTGIKVQSKTKSTEENDDSDMDDSSTTDDEENTTEKTGDSVGSKGSEEDSIGSDNSIKDIKGDSVGSVQNSGSTQEKDFKTSDEDSKEYSLDSKEDSNGPQEHSKDNGLESTEDSSIHAEGTSDVKEGSVGTDKESKTPADSGNISEPLDKNGPEDQHSDYLPSDENSGSKTETNSKYLNTGTEDTDGDGKASKARNDSESNQQDLNTGSTEDSSVIKIGDETNLEGLDTGSADTNSISEDSPDSKMTDNSKTNLQDLNTADSVDSTSTESKVAPGSDPQHNLKTYDESSNTDINSDTSGEDQDLEQNSEAFNNNLDKSSADSNIENTKYEKEVKMTENNINQNEVNSSEDDSSEGSTSEDNNDGDLKQSEDTDMDERSSSGHSENTTPSNDNTGKVNLKHVNSKQNMFTSKPGQTTVSAAMNDNTGKEMEVEKTSGNKKVKPGGKIIETSYRFNDEDGDDDYINQANDIWTSNSHNDNPLLTGEDTSYLPGNEVINQDLQVQPDDSKYGNNIQINGNDIYENSYNTQNYQLQNWKDSKMQAPLQSNDYNWLTTGLKNTQHSQNIQDQTQDYQNVDWKETPYLDHGESQETTEQPHPEKRTTIPTTNIVQSQYTTDGNKNNPDTIKRKQYTTTADALSDNDVYGYAGSIGPFLQKRTFVPHTLASHPEETKKDDILDSLVTDVNEPWIKHFLTKTLEMAVNGDKKLLTSEEDGVDNNQGARQIRRDEVNEVDSVPKLKIMESKENNEDDDMPLDATNNKDDFEDDEESSGNTNTLSKDSNHGDDEQQNKQREKTASTREKNETELSSIHQDIPNTAPVPNLEGIPLSEVLKHIPKDIPNTAPVPNLEGIPLSEVLKHIPKPESSQSPVADIGTIPSQGDDPLKSVIRITTRIPVSQNIPEQTEAVPISTERVPVDNHIPDQSESLPSITARVSGDHHVPDQSESLPSQLATSQMIPPAPQLPSSTSPQQPYIPINPPSDTVPTELATFPGSSPLPDSKPATQIPTSVSQTTNPSSPIASGPTPDLTSSNQAVPAVVGPIIKVITAPGRKVTVKVTSKDQANDTNKGNTKFQSEINNALNNSIQNIGISSSNDVLENTIKEAELIHVLKDAIPVNQRRPVGVEGDLKQGLDDLKDYAVALTEATGLSQAQRDDVADKLARDLLDEMRVMDGRKQELLKELMSFVTAMEVSTFKERLNEIKSQVIKLSSQNPQDIVKIRSTAIKLLDEYFEQLPLPTEQIKETEKNIGHSRLLQSLLKEGEKRILRSKLKKALVDLVADKLL